MDGFPGLKQLPSALPTCSPLAFPKGSNWRAKSAKEEIKGSVDAQRLVVRHRYLKLELMAIAILLLVV
ncbi:MAG: hypothetical protein RMY29_023245 [Nostoc sp. CreGUA01]|nr:hypothetical protein [Nostoc sp. CreGUA01]